MENEENKKIYKKRANAERPFAHMKHTLGWNIMHSKDIEKNQTDLDLITLAHNHKIKQKQEKIKENTPKTKTTNHSPNQISKNYMKKLACT